MTICYLGIIGNVVIAVTNVLWYVLIRFLLQEIRIHSDGITVLIYSYYKQRRKILLAV